MHCFRVVSSALRVLETCACVCACEIFTVSTTRCMGAAAGLPSCWRHWEVPCRDVRTKAATHRPAHCGGATLARLSGRRREQNFGAAQRVLNLIKNHRAPGGLRRGSVCRRLTS